MRCRNYRERVGLRPRAGGLGGLMCALVLVIALSSRVCTAAEHTDSFPTPAEIFQGGSFPDKSSRDVFFLQAIHDRYPLQWPALLEANITEQDYLLAPAKLLQFINELAVAMRDRDDSAAITNLALLTSDRRFFTNINAYHPEILRAAAQALIQLGPNGRKALAASFSQSHYRDDSESLEELAKAVGEARPSNVELVAAMAASAFDFSTTNGGVYPRCTTEMVKNLLLIPEGVVVVRTHLNTNEIFADPVRFQSIVDGIAASRPAELRTALAAMNGSVNEKLHTLKDYPGDYRDALEDLGDRIGKTVGLLDETKPGGK